MRERKERPLSILLTTSCGFFVMSLKAINWSHPTWNRLPTPLNHTPSADSADLHLQQQLQASPEMLKNHHLQLSNTASIFAPSQKILRNTLVAPKPTTCNTCSKHLLASRPRSRRTTRPVHLGKAEVSSSRMRTNCNGCHVRSSPVPRRPLFKKLFPWNGPPPPRMIPLTFLRCRKSRTMSPDTSSTELTCTIPSKFSAATARNKWVGFSREAINANSH